LLVSGQAEVYYPFCWFRSAPQAENRAAEAPHKRGRSLFSLPKSIRSQPLTRSLGTIFDRGVGHGAASVASEFSKELLNPLSSGEPPLSVSDRFAFDPLAWPHLRRFASDERAEYDRKMSVGPGPELGGLRR
jgi:hypothetical protein